MNQPFSTARVERQFQNHLRVLNERRRYEVNEQRTGKNRSGRTCKRVNSPAQKKQLIPDSDEKT